MAENNRKNGKKQWQRTSGFAADTKMVHIIVPESRADTWDQEADETGFDNRSDYLRTLLAEARAFRSDDTLRPRQAEKKIESLQAEVRRLEGQLENEQRAGAGAVSFDDPRFVERFLTENYQPLEEILQSILESGAAEQLIRKPVEDQLYFLAAENDVEFKRGWGWKRTRNGGGR